MIDHISWVIGFLGDVLLCWLTLRYIIQPRLEKFTRRIAREEITRLTGAC